MVKDVADYIYTLLSTDSALVALVGDVERLIYGWPNSFEIMPMVSWLINDKDDYWGDDQPLGDMVNVKLEVWNSKGSETNLICDRLKTVFNAVLFSMTFCDDVPEPNEKLEHKHMEFTRTVFAEDI